jgi:hypothetical protein
MSETPTPPPPPPPPPPAPPSPPATAPAQSIALDGRQPGVRRSVGLTILLSIVTCGVWTWVWSYKNGEELKRWRNEGIGGVGYLFITIFISPVTMFLMASEVEKAYREDERQPPLTTLVGLWFLLPLVGPIVWYVKMQGALNNLWTMHGQTNDPGL